MSQKERDAFRDLQEEMEWAYPYLRDHLSRLRLKKDPMALAFENALAEFDEKAHRRYPEETPAQSKPWLCTFCGRAVAENERDGGEGHIITNKSLGLDWFSDNAKLCRGPLIPFPVKSSAEGSLRDRVINEALDRIAFLTDSGDYHGYRSEMWIAVGKVFDRIAALSAPEYLTAGDPCPKCKTSLLRLKANQDAPDWLIYCHKCETRWGTERIASIRTVTAGKEGEG